MEVIPQKHISYMKGFVNDLYLRPICYECKSKGIRRNTDITLGDYWGVWDLQPHLDDNKGTSLILLHSDKGISIFEDIKVNLVCEEIDLEQAVKANQSIIKSATKNNNRAKFFERMKKGEEFEIIINDLLRLSLGKRIKKKIKCIISRSEIC